MNVIDVVFAIPLLWLAYKGFRKGLIIEVFSLISLILGVYCAIHFSDITYGMLQEHLRDAEDYLPLLSYALTFIVVVVAIHVLGKMIEKVADFTALTLINKAFGAAFGMLKGLVLICALLMLFNPLNDKWNMVDKQYLNNSLLYRPISGFILEWGPSITESETFRQLEEGFNALLPAQP